MVLTAAGASFTCTEAEPSSTLAPVYAGEVDALLRARCGDCHGAINPAGRFRVDSYLGAIGCLRDGRTPVNLPADESAPLVRALSDDLHAGLIDASTRQRDRKSVV